MAGALILSACSNETENTLSTGHAAAANAAVENKATAEGVANVDWPLHGNDWGEQRHSPLHQINAENIAELGLAWAFDLYTRRGVEATPLVIDGKMYVTSSWSVVYALDAATGELLWDYDPKVDRAFLAKGCCDAVNRGAAYADGKILVGAYDGRLIALGADDGGLLWETQTTDREQSYTITGAPRIAGDKVIIGNGGAELGVRGYVGAYDLTTGELVWRFYTVPGNPDAGFENSVMEMAAETWNGKWWEWGGGGTVWDSIVYDPELDLLYIGVGNGSPWNQKLRSPEGGDNLFLASIVALRPDTGEYVWHYQTVPGETWDFTATQHMILADLEFEGEPRKVLMQAPKNGFFYVLDRQTGELLSAEKYTMVTWAESVDMASGRPVESANARLFDGQTPVIPSMGGGHNWPPMAYNPDTGWVYIPTMIFPAAYTEPTREIDTKPGQGYWNLGFDNMGMAPPPLPKESIDAQLDQTFSAQLIAWDPVHKIRRWEQAPQRPNLGGVLSTAGDLIFQAGKQGKLYAHDARTGEELWSADTQTGAMAPPISYSIDGEQYIAVAVGFGGGFAAQGGAIAHHWQTPNISRVLVYKLGGAEQLPAITTSATTTRAITHTEPPSAPDETIAHGQVVYQRHCAYCHGDGLRTGGLIPDLRSSPEAIHQVWSNIVLDGLLSRTGMVGFKDYIDADDAEAIRQYVLAEAQRAVSEQQVAPQ